MLLWANSNSNFNNMNHVGGLKTLILISSFECKNNLLKKVLLYTKDLQKAFGKSRVWISKFLYQHELIFKFIFFQCFEVSSYIQHQWKCWEFEKLSNLTKIILMGSYYFNWGCVILKLTFLIILHYPAICGMKT